MLVVIFSLAPLAIEAQVSVNTDGTAPQQLRENGFKKSGEPRKTGDGYYEFETLDPDNNRLEVTTEIR